VVRSTGLCPNLRRAIRSLAGFAATNARAAAAASASALPAIERDVSRASTTFLQWPRLIACSPTTGRPFSSSCGAVAEAAVVGAPHELKGQAIHAFVTLKSSEKESDILYDNLREWVAQEIGALARPEKIHFVAALPKTRSGKIMRRLLREIVTTKSVAGDTSTLEDYNVILQLSRQGKEEEEILGEKK